MTVLTVPVMAQDPAPQMQPVAQQTAPAAQTPESPVAVAAPIMTPPPEKPKGPITRFFEKLFVSILGDEPDPDPSGTMVAPFAADVTPPQTAEQRASGTLPVNSTSLDRPHRSATDLASWLQQALAETLSFNAETYAGHLKLLERGYTPSAIAEFNAWATGTGILEALQQNQMQLNGFVADPPFLLNEGVIDGRYRWLYEVPVMVSFVPRGTTTYQGKEGIDTRRLIITLQLGRVAVSLLPDHVMVETWSVQENTRRN
ncbi:MAG: DotI/IcmL/TraM family protein [Micavibrio sp.]